MSTAESGENWNSALYEGLNTLFPTIQGPEIQKTVEEALEKHQRIQKKEFRKQVKELERLDRDRRTEIVTELRNTSDLEEDEWTSPNYDEGTIDVDWEKLKENSPDARTINKLESKYGNPAGLFKLSIDSDEDIKFHPGDFFSLKIPETPNIDTTGHQIPEVREETAENETYFRAHSIGSSPNTDEIDLYIKRIPNDEVDNTSLTPVLDAKLEQTDEVILKGPEDDELELKEVSDRDMVYVATGTGMAPLKSMIDFTFEENLDRYNGQNRDVWMFLGASWEDELPGHEEFKQLENEHENFHYVPTVSREKCLSDWEGETEYVQNCLEQYSEQIGKGDFNNNSEIYVCGLSRMAEGVKDTLEDMGFDTDSSRYQQEVFD